MFFISSQVQCLCVTLRSGALTLAPAHTYMGALCCHSSKFLMMRTCFNATFLLLDSLRLSQGSQCLWYSFEIKENYIQEFREIHENQPSLMIFQAVAENKIWMSLFWISLAEASKFFCLKLEGSSPLDLLFLNTDLFYCNDFKFSEKYLISLASMITPKNILAK